MKQLKTNLVIVLEGRPHRVSLVNDCRALCIPLSKKRVEIKTLLGQKASFEREETGISISPTADVPVLGLYRDSMVIDANGDRIPVEQFARETSGNLRKPQETT